ncbi:A-kinase anchor protein 9-like [Homarus americanus]|uniref:A-kinase anchor protein 9-like n=1 Tax=Homarus americanus TaxID=6706 RepID=UPI001C4791E6|nr:A-kinase anchor protein 9-like [Homarus americanus]
MLSLQRAGMENTSACDPASQPSVNQLQEEIHSKQLMIEALQHDNHQRQNENSVSAANAKKIIEHYKEKLQEYQAAVNQRDQMISQLRTRLAECIQSQDDLQAEIHQQTETSTREIETLKLQLKETTESLNKNWTTGINPHEHLELKNKLISIQQDRSQDQQLREQLYMQLSVKKEQYGHLDSKYKHSLQKFKETQMNIEKLTHELKANKEITEILQGENETLIARIQELGDSHRVEIEEQTLKWSAEKKALIEQDRIKDEQINKIENEIKTLTENMKAAENLSDHKLKEIKDKTEKMIERERLGKEKSSCEIQNLMQQLQELTREITHTKEQHQTQLITAEEQFGQQLAVMKQQMSERHNEELLRIKASHESEVAQVTQQIDALEKAQKEDHTSLIENLNSLNNLNINLKEQLEGEKEKLHTLEASLCELRKEKEHLRAEVEGSKERERDLQLELKQEVDTKNDLQQKSEEQRRRYVEIENLVQNLKTETERVKEDLKIETEKRSSNENLLALELQNVKDLSTKKINLEEKLANISQEMNVMCNELSQSKTSKDDLNARFQKAQQRYNEVSYELEEYKKTAKEQELKCQKLRREMKIWLTEKESITAELEQCITILKSEIVKIEKNAKYTTELEKEISLFKHENEELHKRCEKLAQYEQECQILNEKLGQKYSDLKKSEDSHDLREKFLALFDQCQSIELTRKKIETECEEKCECLNDKLQSLDSKLAEASGLCGKFYDISNHSTSVEKKLQDVIQRLKEAEDNIGDREEALMKATFEKDALISEIKQTKIAHDSMEKEKNECEMDRDRMLEQYKMMKAELASTLLALDREVQLSTHRKLTSDVGISVSTSTSFEHSAVQGEFSIDSDQHHLEKDAEKEMVVEKVNVSARIMIKPQENKGNEKFNKILEDRIHNLEKENKELLNEVKKLNTKVHDQHFSVKSLENEKSNLRRRLTEWESEKVKFRAEQEIYEKEMSEKLDLKKQLKEVKLTVHLTEDNLKRQEEEMNCLRKSLKALVERDNSECLVRLNKIVNSFEISSGKTRLQESSNCTAYLKTYLSKQSEEIECMCEELKKYLCKLMELQQHSDKLSEEKLKTELENISLKFEVEKLKSLQSCVEGHEPQSRETDYTPSEVTSPRTEGDGGDLHRELKNYKHENEKLRLDIEKLKTLFKLEKLHMQSTRLNSQKEADKSMGKKELIITHIGTKLEELIEEWDNQVKIDPLLAEFISTQTCKVCDILQKLPGSLSESSDSEAYVDAAIRLIQQAIIKKCSNLFALAGMRQLLKIQCVQPQVISRALVTFGPW